MKDKTKLLMLTPLLASATFVSLFALTSQLPEISQEVSFQLNQENSGVKQIYCKNDVADDQNELSLILENNVKAVNCLFGGCNSLF